MKLLKLLKEISIHSNKKIIVKLIDGEIEDGYYEVVSPEIFIGYSAFKKGDTFAFTIELEDEGGPQIEPYDFVGDLNKWGIPYRETDEYSDGGYWYQDIEINELFIEVQK